MTNAIAEAPLDRRYALVIAPGQDGVPEPANPW
jgi:hypothetical protein